MSPIESKSDALIALREANAENETLRSEVEEKRTLLERMGDEIGEGSLNAESNLWTQLLDERDELRGSLEEWKLDFAALRSELARVREALEAAVFDSEPVETDGRWSSCALCGETGDVPHHPTCPLPAARAALSPAAPQEGE